MSFKQLYLRIAPPLIASLFLALYLMGTSDYEDLLYIEQLKQEQRDRVQAASADVRQAYAMNPLHRPNDPTPSYLPPPYTAKNDFYRKNAVQENKEVAAWLQ